MAPIKVLVCGGGNGAHVLAGLASLRENVECRVLTLFENEAERWTNAMAEEGFGLTLQSQNEGDVELKAEPFMVTKDPKVAVTGCTVIFLVVPAFAHHEYLEKMKPYLEDQFILVGLPGKSGFEFAVKGILGEKAKSCALISYETLPWACRITEFGKRVLVIGTKSTLQGSMSGLTEIGELGNAEKIVQKIIGPLPKLTVSGHLLGLSLNGPLHPGIMYGRWHNWDGKPLDYEPLFYQGIDKETGDLLDKLSNEKMAIKKAIIEKHKNVDLNNVIHMKEWYLSAYGEDIEDKNTVHGILTTNRSYQGLTHPMKKTADGKLFPDFAHRYMSEDLPFCLTVMKGIALLAGVPTPESDKVLIWSQDVMNKEWMVDGKLIGKDMNTSRAPQRYGFTKLEDIL